jgi:hypothetical protein
MVLCALGIGPTWATETDCVHSDYGAVEAGLWTGGETLIPPPFPGVDVSKEWDYWLFPVGTALQDKCDVIETWQDSATGTPPEGMHFYLSYASVNGTSSGVRHMVIADGAQSTSGTAGPEGLVLEGGPWELMLFGYGPAWDGPPTEYPPIPEPPPVEVTNVAGVFDDGPGQAVALALALVVFLASAGFTRSFARGSKA